MTSVSLKAFALGAALGLVLAVAPSCGGGANGCDPSSCAAGCCTKTGVCLAGTAVNACGKGGLTCNACSAGQSCTAGSCGSTFTGGGQGGGSGGGGGSMTNNCSPSNCVTGCCQNNTCAPGTANDSCGTAGMMCVACTAGKSCDHNVCNVTTTTVNDAGTTVNDAGSTINVHDAGTTVTDAGTLTDDAGTLVNDAGTATDDAGAMTDDAGTTTDDAGTMEFDAGTFDAGMPVTCAPSVVISQIYGGGGNLSATFKNDFFELHNRTDVAVSLDGWSIQYASFSGTSWKVINLAGPIAANGFFLVGLGNNGGTVGAALPAADLADTTTDISAIHGKVILVSKQTVVSGICPTSDAALVDFVGFGPDQTCAEASSPAPAGGNALAVTRRAISGSSLSCNDSNNNTADFEAATPSPRNSSSSASACTCTQ